MTAIYPRLPFLVNCLIPTAYYFGHLSLRFCIALQFFVVYMGVCVIAEFSMGGGLGALEMAPGTPIARGHWAKEMMMAAENARTNIMILVPRHDHVYRGEVVEVYIGQC